MLKSNSSSASFSLENLFKNLSDAKFTFWWLPLAPGRGWIRSHVFFYDRQDTLTSLMTTRIDQYRLIKALPAESMPAFSRDASY
jgi:hypothetical protein